MTYFRPVITTLAARALRRTAAVLGLGLSQGGAYWAVEHRLIAEPTEKDFDLTALRRSYGYQRQGFGSADQLRRWRTHDAAERAIEDGALVVRPSGQGLPYIRLAHEIDLSAADVREVVIVVEGLRRGRLRLLWAIPGQGFADTRRLQLDAGGDAAVAYRFEVAGHAAWRGRIHALRLDVPNVAGQEARIRSFATRGRAGYEAEMLARIVGQDWKVEIGHEARNAVLTAPDVPRRWRLPRPTTGSLRFAYGLPRGSGPPLRFRIAGVRGEQRLPLFADTVDPRDGTRAGRWIEAIVELTEKVDGLVFETSAPPGYRIDAGLPAWAHPEILAPGRDRPRPNVVLISIDTLRADRLGAYGYAEPTSPNIDRWARSSAVTFRRAVATAPWTLPSHVSMP